jgi:Icc-related predicted phosphoesterase
MTLRQAQGKKNMEKKRFKIAALADIHVHETSQGLYKELFKSISDQADIVLLCGDLTDLGLQKEAEVLAEELQTMRIPVVAVLGNHDYESGMPEKVSEILKTAKVYMLEGTDYLFEHNGKQYGITGVKGFGGGFQPYMWSRFGEPEQKAFYDALAQEIQALENGLNRLRHLEKGHCFVMTHFAPIRATLHGEIPELYAFLGSTRMEEVIDRYENVAAVVHGHSHFGAPEGKTTKGIPVFNVAYPLMQRVNAKQPFRIIEL